MTKTQLHRPLSLVLLSALAIGCGEATDEPEAADPKEASVAFAGVEDPVTVPYEVVDGLAIYQGDIILGEVDENGELVDEGFRAIVHKDARFGWPQGLVPVNIADDVSENEVRDAMQAWEDRTLIRFVDYDPNLHENYIDVIRGTDPNACYSALGMTGGRQTLRMSSFGNCGLATTIHEFGHALGLHHEHNRGDRDDFVTINWNNILSGRESQFCRRAGDDLSGTEADFCFESGFNGIDNGAYDYDSIMHYDDRAFGESEGGLRQITISPKTPGVSIGDATAPSDGDAEAVDELYGFVTSQWASNFCRGDAEVCQTGDVDGDGDDDIVAFHHDSNGSREVWVATSDGEGRFENPKKWASSFCMQSEEECRTGDFDGDGADDILTFHNGAWGGSSTVFVYLSDRVNSFDYTGAPWTSGFCMQSQEKCETGDFNGDGRDDIITFHNGAWGGGSTVYVYTSDGSRFNYTGSPWHTDFCPEGMVCRVGDVNGDGRDDAVSFVQSTYGGVARNDVYVSLSTGSGFATTYKWHDNFCAAGERCLVGDVDGDGLADVMAIPHSGSNFGVAKIARSTGSSFSPVEVSSKTSCFYSSYECMLADPNGDDHQDLVVFTQSLFASPDGQVSVAQSGLKHAGE